MASKVDLVPMAGTSVEEIQQAEAYRAAFLERHTRCAEENERGAAEARGKLEKAVGDGKPDHVRLFSQIVAMRETWAAESRTCVERAASLGDADLWNEIVGPAYQEHQTRAFLGGWDLLRQGNRKALITPRRQCAA